MGWCSDGVLTVLRSAPCTDNDAGAGWQLLQRIDAHHTPVLSLVLSPQQWIVSSAQGTDTLHLSHSDGGSSFSVSAAPGVRSLAIAQDNVLLSAGEDGTVHEWQPLEQHTAGLQRQHTWLPELTAQEPVSAVAVQADGLLVIGDKQGVLRCFALE